MPESSGRRTQWLYPALTSHECPPRLGPNRCGELPLFSLTAVALCRSTTLLVCHRRGHSDACRASFIEQCQGSFPSPQFSVFLRSYILPINGNLSQQGHPAYLIEFQPTPSAVHNRRIESYLAPYCAGSHERERRIQEVVVRSNCR